LGGHEDWTGWLLKNGKDSVDYVSEHTYSYPRLAYDAQKQSFVNVNDPLPMQARRTANRIGEALEVFDKYAEKMPWLKEKGVRYIFDEWGCRQRGVGGFTYQAPGMLTPLCYALFLNEMFRHSDMVGASCATGSMGTVLVDNTGETAGFSADGLVLKIMANHFGNALPVAVSGNSPQQPVAGTPWVDIPKTPIGSATFPLDVVAALSSDRKKLIVSVVNPTEEKQEFSPKVTGVKLRGPGKLWQIAPPSLNSANVPGQKAAVEIVESAAQGMGETVQVPAVSVSVWEWEIG
jgi:alpha-N-arabinofuranosidase